MVWHFCDSECAQNWVDHRKDPAMKKMLRLTPLARFKQLDRWELDDLTLDLTAVPEVSNVVAKWHQIPSYRELQPRPSRMQHTSRRSVLAVSS